jgi:hypothetical protein
MDERRKRIELALAIRAWGEALHKRFFPPPPRQQDMRCDHYWLYRRGGVCPYCGERFAGRGR